MAALLPTSTALSAAVGKSIGPAFDAGHALLVQFVRQDQPTFAELRAASPAIAANRYWVTTIDQALAESLPPSLRATAGRFAERALAPLYHGVTDSFFSEDEIRLGARRIILAGCIGGGAFLGGFVMTVDSGNLLGLRLDDHGYLGIALGAATGALLLPVVIKIFGNALLSGPRLWDASDGGGSAEHLVDWVKSIISAGLVGCGGALLSGGGAVVTSIAAAAGWIGVGAVAMVAKRGWRVLYEERLPRRANRELLAFLNSETAIRRAVLGNAASAERFAGTWLPQQTGNVREALGELEKQFDAAQWEMQSDDRERWEKRLKAKRSYLDNIDDVARRMVGYAKDMGLKEQLDAEKSRVPLLALISHDQGGSSEDVHQALGDIDTLAGYLEGLRDVNVEE